MVFDADRWKAAKTLPEFGELTALWAEGVLSGGPHNGGSPPDEETDAIRDHLAILNRNGFITDFSQPAMMYPDWWQRAAVCGFCDEHTAGMICSILIKTPLIVIPHGPDSSADIRYQIVITIAPNNEDPRFWDERTWCGSPYDKDTIDWYFRKGADDPESCLDEDLVRELEAAWQITVLDPVWGREDLLWGLLVIAVQAARDALA